MSKENHLGESSAQLHFFVLKLLCQNNGAGPSRWTVPPIFRLGPAASRVRGKSKGGNMESKVAKSVIAIKVLIVFMMMWAFAANAADQGGAPPSGAGQAAEVKVDNTPIPKSGVLSITFLGNKKFTSEQLAKVIEGTELKLGGKVGPAIIGPAMTALVDFYKKNGATLSASPNIIEDPKGITFVQFIIDESASKGDIGGLVSSGGPHIFCAK